MDRMTLVKIVDELHSRLAGAALNKIFQTDETSLVLRCWNGRENLRLMISVASGQPLLGLLREAPANPAVPPRFAQLLRARLARLIDLTVLPDDLIVKLHFVGKDQQGYHLYAELFRQQGNLVLTDANDRIIDVMLRQTALGDRKLAPGTDYVPPIPPPRAKASSEENSPEPAEVDVYLDLTRIRQSEFSRSRMEKVLRSERRRLQRRLNKIEQVIDAGDQSSVWQKRGDLLLSNLYRLQRGQAQVTLTDYSLDPPAEVTVRLEPKLTPQENAERCYHKARKLRRGLEHEARRLQETRLELQWLEQVRHDLEQAVSAAELEQLSTLLREVGLLRETKQGAGRSRTKPTGGLQKTESPSGCTVLFGTQSRANDTLYRQHLNANDLWFHANDLPGSHVVLKQDQQKATEADIEFAASLAAGYSKGRGDSKVEVMVTAGRNVRKPKGAKPGMVTVDSYRTIVVAPSRLDES